MVCGTTARIDRSTVIRTRLARGGLHVGEPDVSVIDPGSRVSDVPPRSGGVVSQVVVLPALAFDDRHMKVVGNACAPLVCRVGSFIDVSASSSTTWLNPSSGHRWDLSVWRPRLERAVRVGRVVRSGWRTSG